MNTIHLLATSAADAIHSTACGLTLGGVGWQGREGDEVITDPEESGDATCSECIARTELARS